MARYMCNFGNNNSGGSFWIHQKEADILEANGWTIDYGYGSKPGEKGSGIYKDTFSYATKEFEGKDAEFAARKAELEVEELISISFDAEGCRCCGKPFSMYAHEINDA